MASRWFVMVNGTVKGPIPDKKLKQLAIKGRLQPEMQVRRGVEGQWVAAGEISGLYDDTPRRSADSIPLQGGERFYRPTGSVPTLGIVLVPLIGIPVTLLVGGGYGVLEAINPFIYVSVIGTLVAGLGVAVTNTGICSATNVRSRAFRVLSGIALGGMTVYFSWVFSLWAYFDFNSDFRVWNPIALMEFIGLVADEGLWTLNDNQPTGVVLYIVWAVEAGLIVGCSTILSLVMDDAPYCEDCSCWTEETQNVWSFSSAASSTVFAELESERYQALFSYQDEILDDNDHLVIDLHLCPQCNQSNYLTVRHLETTIAPGLQGTSGTIARIIAGTDDGKTETKDTKLVKALRIPAELVAELVQDDRASETEV